MNALLGPWMISILAVLHLTSGQDPVPIQFQRSPVLVATGNDAVFTVQTISNIFSITWLAPGGSTLGQWINSQAVLNPIAQYQGRVSITATQLTISSSQLGDAGKYTVTVTPSAPTGLATNSLSVTLSVFVAVGEVSLSVPSVTIEGGNASLTCSWTTGTNTSMAWGKGSTNLPSDPRFIVNAGSLMIKPVNRNDAGQYTCTVSNPVSSKTATASLTVYYGPDTPQVTRSSSECVGGGDAIVGQTVQLTCKSVSLPPALLSWQFNGLPLTASQANDGTLNLQVFSTNQSGQYTCVARNSITTQTSQQQISLSVAGTCLSVGAVAGIVVACFVALVLIIVAIVLILRQRNVDQRLRTVIAQRKENLNNKPEVFSAPQNGHDNSGFLGLGDQHDPPLQNDSRLDRSKTQQQSNGQRNINNDILTQNRTPNISAIQANANVNAEMLSNNANLHSSAHLHRSQWNSNLNQHNSGSFQQAGQQNPNILIQTGHAEPGPHTVLINLNTLSQHQNATTQPHTVQVSLNTPRPSSGQRNQNTMQYNDQQSNIIQQGDAPTSHANGHHVSGSRSSPQNRMDNVLNMPQSAYNSSLGNGHPRDHHITDQTRSRQNTEDTHNYSEQTGAQLDRTLSVNYSDSSTHPRQMPWDRIHGTPAYPNPQLDSYESRNITRQNSSLDSETEYSAPALRPWRSPANRQVRNISRTSRRNLLRELAHSAAQTRSRADRNMPRQIAQPNAITQPSTDNHSWTAPQNVTSQIRDMNNTDTAVHVPQHQTVHMQAARPTHLISQAAPDQRQPGPLDAVIPNSQQHTSQTSSPFANQNQQTQAALQHPGTQSVPAQNLPARQINRAGQVVPDPPPVLRPTEFKTLPREHLQKPHAVKPVHVMSRPAVVHHGHRPLNMTRHARPTRNNLHNQPVHHHKHASAHWHGTTQGIPMSQVHRRSRHRP